MRQQKKDYSPFKNRLQTRRLCEVGTRRDSRRSRVYMGQIASVLVRIG
jgi:hypothetical protein